MQRKYVRTTLRASWSEKDLNEAMEKVKTKQMEVNEAFRAFSIPLRTLKRHISTGKSKVPLGRSTVLSKEHEQRLVAHIKKLEKVEFAPDCKDVKELVYQFAEKLKMKYRFCNTSMPAGNVWLSGFLRRNPELSIRKSEGLSLARAHGMNRNDVQEFFNILLKIYEENDLLNNPGNHTTVFP